MDTPPPFTLSLALDAWRSSLPALPPDDLAELESHLLDSMAELQKTGLSESEALMIARSRLGSPADLAEGFHATPAGSPPLPLRANLAEKGAKKPARRFGFLFCAFGLLALTVALALSIWLLLAPKQYAAHVLLEIMRTPALSELDSVKGPGPEQPASGEQFLATQLEIVTDRETLILAVRRRGLLDRWKVRSVDEAVARLRRMVSARAQVGTNLIRLTVLSADKKEAAELADDVALAYVRRREKLDMEYVNVVLAQITQSRKGQEQMVERSLTRVDELAKQLNIADPAPEGPPYSGPPGNPGVDGAGQYEAYNRAKAEYQVQLKILREILGKQENARRINLMPPEPARFQEHASEPQRYTFPNTRLWLTVAVLIGVLGALSFIAGLLRWRRRLGRKQESAVQAAT